MKNQYKSAGILNILCGVLFTISYIFPNVLIGVTLGWGDAFATVFALTVVFIYAGYVWWSFIIFVPFSMILTGTEMISKHKKGTGVKAWIVLNALVKLLVIGYQLVVGCLFLTAPTALLVVWGWGLIAMSFVTLISVIIDFKALFTRTRKN